MTSYLIITLAYFVALGPLTSVFLLFKAYRQGLYGSSYVWILAGPLMNPNWIDLVDKSSLGCTFEEFLKAAKGHFALNYDQIDSANPVTIANQVIVNYVNSPMLNVYFLATVLDQKRF